MKKILILGAKLFCIFVVSVVYVLLSPPALAGLSEIVNAEFAIQMLGVIAAVTFVIVPLTISELNKKVASTDRSTLPDEKVKSIQEQEQAVRQELKEDTLFLMGCFILAFFVGLLSELTIPVSFDFFQGFKQPCCSTILLFCMISALWGFWDLLKALFGILMSSRID